MNKRINTDFYKVFMSNDSSASFETILQRVIQLPIQDRFKEVRQYPLCLRQAESVWQQCWEGEMIRLRMDDLPVKGSLSGNIEALVFNDDEGIGEQTAFVYHPPTRVLVLQANQSGVSASNFVKYFELMNNANEPIYIDPVIQASALEKLAKLNAVSKLEIQVAGLDKMNIFQNQDYGVKEIINLSNEFRSPIINIEFSVGRKKRESLSLEKAKDTATGWLRISSENKREVKKIRISGSSDDRENVYIDLLKDRMRESVDIKKTGRSRTISYYDRRQAVQESWQRREKELFSMFGEN